MSVSNATPRAIAGKIVSTHNSHTCYACQRELPEGGVLAFGLSGSDPRYYPDAETAERKINGVRYVFPHAADRDVDLDEVTAWLDAQRDEIDRAVEWVEAERAERRAARELREQGIHAAAWPCDDCGHPKRRPADRCDHCGDEPVPIGIDHHEYNRSRGYID